MCDAAAESSITGRAMRLPSHTAAITARTSKPETRECGPFQAQQLGY